MALVRERGLDHVRVLVGGIIPEADMVPLRAMGIEAVFLPGRPMQDIVEFIKQTVDA